MIGLYKKNNKPKNKRFWKQKSIRLNGNKRLI